LDTNAQRLVIARNDLSKTKIKYMKLISGW
jgi:hypothetical protein